MAKKKTTSRKCKPAVKAYLHCRLTPKARALLEVCSVEADQSYTVYVSELIRRDARERGLL